MNTNSRIVFDRDFQIWEYSVSHSRLLLRSVKEPQLKTRVDILFKNVGFISIPTFLAQLTIEETVSSTVNLVSDKSFYLERKTYQLTSKNCDGYVIAGLVAYHEDDGEYDDMSALLI